MNSELLQELKAYEPELIEIRRDIHRHPEIGFHTKRTGALAAQKLGEWGIDAFEGLAETGVVGALKGRRAGGRAIGLRADMDALMIEEVEGRAHRSTYAGKMHACGHDGHTTMLLGAARYLAEHRDFAGTVYFIFQPAEEGQGGGRRMVEDGLFERFPMDAAHGMHNFPGLPVGTFATRKGPMLAATGFFSAAFRGAGGHGGNAPETTVDVSLAAAQYVLTLQTIVSRNIKASETAVISVGYVGGGDPGAPNVIPALMTVSGTWRCFSDATRDIIERRLRELAEHAAASYGAGVEFVSERVTPMLATDAEATDVALKAARALVGERAVVPDMAPVTGGEDFAYMLQKKRGSFMIIGNGVDPSQRGMLHTPDYDFNDAILTLGAAYWVSLVREELG